MIRRIFYILYLLQLENYDLARFLNAFFRYFIRIPRDLRKRFVWTVKMRVLFTLSLAFALTFIFASWFAARALPVFFQFAAAAGALGFAYAFFGIWCVVAVVFLSPLDWLVKTVYCALARAKLKRMPRCIVIGVTGSYGKTTMKELCAALLQEKYRVVKTPENMNTPLGLARCILRDVRGDTEVFLAEMGAYREGDIRTLCSIAQPSVSILTGINESHLERFGSLERTVRAKFEIVRFAKPDAVAVLNADNDLISSSFQEHTGTKHVIWYGAAERASYRIVSSGFLQESLSTEFALRDPAGKTESYAVRLCAPYIASAIAGCIAVAKHMGMTDAQMRLGLSVLQPVPHRLQPLKARNGALIIDDSYNGNPDGARAAMEFLKSWRGGRRIYVTPGLVELGTKMEEIHVALGRELAACADKVALIKSPGAFWLRSGLQQAGFTEPDVFWFETAQDAHRAIQKMMQPGDCVVFQNDLPENYL